MHVYCLVFSVNYGQLIFGEESITIDHRDYSLDDLISEINVKLAVASNSTELKAIEAFAAKFAFNKLPSTIVDVTVLVSPVVMA